MARKRKALKEIEYNSTEYWNKLLNQEGLSVDRGRSKKLLYAGGTSDIELLESARRTSTGRVAPVEPEDEENRG